MEAKFLISGDTAISVQMGDEISLEVNQKVRGLMLDLTKNPIDGVTEMVPAYASSPLAEGSSPLAERNSSWRRC